MCACCRAGAHGSAHTVSVRYMGQADAVPTHVPMRVHRNAVILLIWLKLCLSLLGTGRSVCNELSKTPYACLLFLLTADSRCLTMRAGKEVWMGVVFY